MNTDEDAHKARSMYLVDSLNIPSSIYFNLLRNKITQDFLPYVIFSDYNSANTYLQTNKLNNKYYICSVEYDIIKLMIHNGIFIL
jgi:hypothetical protein